MSFDKYSDKASEAIALIREFAKVEYWDYFKGDPEQALEAFCAMQDAAEEMGRQECAAKTDSQKIYKDFDEFWKTAPSNYAKDRYTIEFSIGIWEAAYKAALSQDIAAPQDNVPGVSELPPLPTPCNATFYPNGVTYLAKKLPVGSYFTGPQMIEYAKEYGEACVSAALRAYGQRAVAPQEVWSVSSKTFLMLFATEELAKQFTSGFAPSISGGFGISRVPVNGAVASSQPQDGQRAAVSVSQWKPLNDVQWMNIVNHDHAYESVNKEEAVHEAVKRTEAKLRELNAAPSQPQQEAVPAAEPKRNLTLGNAPIGTKAPSINGGAWYRTERGWKWNNGATFPRPGGDWNGDLIAPSAIAMSAAKEPGSVQGSEA